MKSSDPTAVQYSGADLDKARDKAYERGKADGIAVGRREAEDGRLQEARKWAAELLTGRANTGAWLAVALSEESEILAQWLVSKPPEPKDDAPKPQGVGGTDLS